MSISTKPLQDTQTRFSAAHLLKYHLCYVITKMLFNVSSCPDLAPQAAYLVWFCS